MRLVLARRPRAWLLVAATLVVAATVPSLDVQPAAASEADLAQLPVVEPYRCLLCHVADPDQTGRTERNPFGRDYLDNLRTWNETLAALDSDGDGCTNGVELGDVDGDGSSDGNIDRLQSNPGVETDCGGASVDSRTWGELKSLFDGD